MLYPFSYEGRGTSARDSPNRGAKLDRPERGALQRVPHLDNGHELWSVTAYSDSRLEARLCIERGERRCGNRAALVETGLNEGAGVPALACLGDLGRHGYDLDRWNDVWSG